MPRAFAASSTCARSSGRLRLSSTRRSLPDLSPNPWGPHEEHRERILRNGRLGDQVAQAPDAGRAAVPLQAGIQKAAGAACRAFERAAAAPVFIEHLRGAADLP